MPVYLHCNGCAVCQQLLFTLFSKLFLSCVAKCSCLFLQASVQFQLKFEILLKICFNFEK